MLNTAASVLDNVGIGVAIVRERDLRVLLLFLILRLHICMESFCASPSKVRGLGAVSWAASHEHFHMIWRKANAL